MNKNDNSKQIEGVILSDNELEVINGGSVNVNEVLSSNKKINSSKDDPSGYQISERMKVRIRAKDKTY